MLIRNRLRMSRAGCEAKRRIFGLRFWVRCACVVAGASARIARRASLAYSIKVMCSTVARTGVALPSTCQELVPEVQRSLDNGRALQDLLHQAAPRYIKALKRERAEAKKSDEG